MKKSALKSKNRKKPSRQLKPRAARKQDPAGSAKRGADRSTRRQPRPSTASEQITPPLTSDERWDEYLLSEWEGEGGQLPRF